MNQLKKFGLCYLATVYRKHNGGPDAAFVEAARISARLVLDGVSVFCPIVHGHPLSQYGGLFHDDHEFWMAVDRPFMARCDAIVVAQMDGWDRSDGIAEEVAFFKAAGRPVFILNPDTMEISE